MIPRFKSILILSVLLALILNTALSPCRAGEGQTVTVSAAASPP